jgi:hypothetical protein
MRDASATGINKDQWEDIHHDDEVVTDNRAAGRELSPHSRTWHDNEDR